MTMAIRFNFRDRMKNAGYNQKDLAERVGIAPWRLGRYVNSQVKRIDVGVLNNLCRYLDCTPGDILEYVPDE